MANLNIKKAAEQALVKSPAVWRVEWREPWDIQTRLKEGWEPFAVTSSATDNPQTKIWLRQKR